MAVRNSSLLIGGFGQKVKSKRDLKSNHCKSIFGVSEYSKKGSENTENARTTRDVRQIRVPVSRGYANLYDVCVQNHIQGNAH